MIAARALPLMFIVLTFASACSNEECDFPSDEEILTRGQSETIQVMVNQGRIEQVQAAGWTYSVYPWEMREGSEQKQWKHPKVSWADGVYSGKVTALGDQDLMLTGVADDRFLLKPVGCY